MKKRILPLLFFMLLILSSCSGNKEDPQEYVGIISDGHTWGYHYTVTKDQNTFSWIVSYKGDTTSIEENVNNQADLVKYMNAVNDSGVEFAKLVLSLSYFFIIAIISLILYKKNRRILSDGKVIITILAGIALYIVFKASFDLTSTLQAAKYYYYVLTR